MTFSELPTGAFFTFSPGYIQYEKTSDIAYKTRHCIKVSFFRIKDRNALVNEIN